MKKNKVLVVGAGPAGVCCAYFLKKYDISNEFDVYLIDKLKGKKYSFYHKSCGEVVSDKIIDNIRPLKPVGIVGEIKKVIEHWPGEIDIETKMDGYIIDRPKMFSHIKNEFEKLGGIFLNERIKEFKQSQDGVKVKFYDSSENYDFLVAADGANSVIRRKLGLYGRTKTLMQYVIEKKAKKDVLEFFYDEKYEGDYKWIFPNGKNSKIGFPSIKGKKFLDLKSTIIKQARSVGYGGLKKYVDGRVLLIGDAACQTNAITKGGIRPGIAASKLAAKAIIERQPNKYDLEWKKSDFSSELFLRSFEKLKLMDNNSLKKHMEPFNNLDIDSWHKKYLLTMKILFKYYKFSDLYKSYDLSNKFGW